MTMQCCWNCERKVQINDMHGSLLKNKISKKNQKKKMWHRLYHCPLSFHLGQKHMIASSV